MNQPTNWSHVLACPCGSCLAMTEIYNRCMAANEILFVMDCRMFPESKPWVIANIEAVFISKAREEDKFAAMEEAVVAVLNVQQHCDVFLSSWPLKQPGSRDYLWHREDVG